MLFPYTSVFSYVANNINLIGLYIELEETMQDAY